jgi:hypothetical protein
MKGLGWIIGGVLLLTGKRSAPAQTGSQLGQYATPALPRAGSTASRTQAGKTSSSSGGGGGAPGTQAAGKSFWNALENLFSASPTDKINVADSPDPSVPDFWATPGTPQGGTTDTLGSLIGSLTEDSGTPQFDNPNGFQFDDNGLVIDPNTGVPFGQTSTDVTTPGGFFPDQFGPEPPPDSSQTEDPAIFDNSFF